MPQIRITALIFAVLSLLGLLIGTFSEEWRYRYSKYNDEETVIEYREGWGLTHVSICLKCLLNCHVIHGERRACETIPYVEHLESLERRLERDRKLYWDDAPNIVKLEKEIASFRAIRRWGPVVKWASFAGLGLAVLFIVWALLHRRRLPRLVPLVSGAVVGLGLIALDVTFILVSRAYVAPKVTYAAVLHPLACALLIASAYCLYRKPVDPFAAVMAEVTDKDAGDKDAGDGGVLTR